jgi:hypothetical protein
LPAAHPCVNDRVEFLAAIGITADEHAFAAEQGREDLLARLLPQNPPGVIELERRSIVAD